MSDNIGPLLEQAPKDFKALARLLTAIEAAGLSALKHRDLLTPAKPALRIGVTGPPGAGKSTLIGELLKLLRPRVDRIAVLAVDPSSPFTRGAILGDRIRFQEHLGDDRVFVRSLGSRGSLGGLSASAYLLLRAFDHCAFDVVLIETVGVGQTELEIVHVADYVAVVLVPESGDAIQAMKAGLLEIADLFVVNKGDRPGAAALARELKALGPEVLTTVATQGQGVAEIADWLLAHQPKPLTPERLQWEARSLLRSALTAQLEAKVSQITTPEQLRDLTQYVK